MYAIIETCGKQYRVEPGAKIRLDRLEGEEGSSVTFDRVLLVDDNGVKVGAPTIEGASVEAKIVSHTKGDKVVTFKYRPRKRYRRRVGFRHSHTTLEITKINA